jgi:hypothetical protein
MSCFFLYLCFCIRIHKPYLNLIQSRSEMLSKDSPPNAMRIRYVEVPDVDLPRLVAKRQYPLLAVH